MGKFMHIINESNSKYLLLTLSVLVAPAFFGNAVAQSEISVRTDHSERSTMSAKGSTYEFSCNNNNIRIEISFKNDVAQFASVRFNAIEVSSEDLAKPNTLMAKSGLLAGISPSLCFTDGRRSDSSLVLTFINMNEREIQYTHRDIGVGVNYFEVGSVRLMNYVPRQRP